MEQRAQYVADRIAALLFEDAFVHDGADQLGNRAFYNHWAIHDLIYHFFFMKDAPMRKVVEEFAFCFGPIFPSSCLAIVVSMVSRLSHKKFTLLIFPAG